VKALEKRNVTTCYRWLDLRSRSGLSRDPANGSCPVDGIRRNRQSTSYQSTSTPRAAKKKAPEA